MNRPSRITLTTVVHPIPIAPDDCGCRAGAIPSAKRASLFRVAQIFNLPYGRIVFGKARDGFTAPAFLNAWESATLRYRTARQSRNQNGPRLVLRTQPRSAKSSRLATIPTDIDRLQVCATRLAN